ncbi:MAG: flagellin [Solibacillus sp.]
MRIHANLSALNTQNRMKANQTNLTKTLEKLSSGYKINRASDDAAGLTISEGMRAQIRGLNRAALNAQDGLSYATTSDAVVQETAHILHRMRELTVQALNDTNTVEDRKLIQEELDQLKGSIQNISEDTRYNDTLKAVEPHESSYGMLEGIRVFDGPAIIKEGINDELSFSANGQTTTIKIPSGKYDPVELLVDEIDTILMEKNENIIVSLTKDKRLAVQIENAPDIAKIKGNGSSLFFDYEIGNKPGMIIGTTDYSTGDQKLTITAGKNDTLSFYIGPTNEVSITFQAGRYTRDEIIATINQHIQGTGAEASAYGEKNISISSDTYSVTGLNGNMFKVDEHSSVIYDNVFYGNVDKTQSYFYSAKQLPNTITLNDPSSSFTIQGYTKGLAPKQLQINLFESGETAPKTFTKDGLLTFIQEKLDAADMAAKVSLKSGYLHMESELWGSNYDVRITNYGNTKEVEMGIFCEKMSSTYPVTAVQGGNSAASIQGNYSANREPMIISPTNNELKLKVDNTEYTLTIPDGSYTVQQMKDFLNSELATNGLNTVSVDSVGYFNRQAFTLSSATQTIQLVNSSALNTIFGGESISSPIPQQGTTGAIKYPQEGTVGAPEIEQLPATVVGQVSISSGLFVNNGNNKLNFKVNGAAQSIQLANGYYTKETLLTELEQKLANTGVEASFDGNYLKLTTINKGQGVTLREVSGLGMDLISVTGAPTTAASPTVTTTALTGYIEFKNNPPTMIEIDATNNKMSFNFTDNGVSTTVNLEIPEGSYKPLEMIAQLNTALAINYSGVDATFKQNGVNDFNRFSLVADGPGNQYQITNMSGGLYKDLFTTRYYTAVPMQIGGYSNVAEAYTVGRQPLDETVEIFPSTNDVLTFDVKYKGSDYTIDVQLPPSNYTPTNLASTFNAQLKKQLVDAGLPEDLLSAQIGVQNNNQNISNADKFVLVAREKTDGRDDNGELVIDGIRGSAAYTFFYQSSGIPKPSYVTGINDLSAGLVIEKDKNDQLSIDVDNQTYHLTFPEGAYNAEQLLDIINTELAAKNTGLHATYQDNLLRFSYKENGMVPIDGITGNARDDLFFKTERRHEDNDIALQIGANNLQSMIMKQTTLSDRLLRIHTINITRPEQAQRALTKLDFAINKVTDKLGNLGAVQNRLEASINVNKRIEENLQKSEALIRDADMAHEMMKFTKQNILSQAMQTMLAQATQAPQATLELLK